MRKKTNTEKAMCTGIGIDLGDTYAVMSYIDNDKKHIFIKESGQNIFIPTCIFYKDREDIYYGSEAKQFEKSGEKGCALSSFTKCMKAGSRKFKVRVPLPKNKKGCYVIDTNVFIDKPDILEVFEDGEEVILPITVEEELSYRCEDVNTKYSAKRALDEIMSHRDRIVFAESDASVLPSDFFRSFTENFNNANNDNRILSIAIANKAKGAVLISSDVRLTRFKAKHVGVKALTLRSFLANRMNESQDEFDVSGMEATGLFLSYLKKLAQDEVGSEIKSAVITAPAVFDDSEVENLRRAALRCGFERASIEKMPIAAAVGLGLDPTVPSNIFVYDLGGSSLNVSVLNSHAATDEDNADEDRPQAGEISADDNIDADETDNIDADDSGGSWRDFEIISSAQGSLGAEDFTDALAEIIYEFLEDEFDLLMYSREESALSVRQYRNNLYAIYSEAKRCKIELDRESFVSVNFDGLYIEPDKAEAVSFEISRKEFEERIAPKLNTAVMQMNSAISQAGLQKSDIDKIILIGGGSLTPCVRTQVRRYFGSAALFSQDKNAATLPVEGAAMMARVLYGASALSDDEVASHSIGFDIGLALKGFNFDCLISSGAALPAKIQKKYFLTDDAQSCARLKFYSRKRGDESKTKVFCGMGFLGEIALLDIPKIDKNEVYISLDMELSKERLLKVKAALMASDKDIICEGEMEVEI